MHLKTLLALAALAAATELAGAQGEGAAAQAPAPVPAQAPGASPGQAPAAAPALSLDEVIAKAVSNQPLILQAEASVAAAKAKEEQAKSAYLPTVSAAASYLYLWPQEGEELNFKPYLPIDIQAPLTPLNMLDFHVGANMLIYDFGKRELQVKIAASGVDAAGIGIDQIKTSIAFQAAQVFDSALFLRDEIKAIDEQLATLQQHLEDTQKREETGSSTHLDVLTTQVRLASVKSLRIDAEGQYAKQMIALKELMGLADADGFDIQGDFSLAPSLGDAKAVLETAMSQRPDLAQSLSAEKQAQLALSLAKLGHMPTISTQAEAGVKNGVLTFTNTDVDTLLFNWDFGLMVSVPVFDGLLTERRSAEAAARLAAARSGTEALRRSVETQVLQALQDLESSHEQTLNSMAQLDQAQEALNMAKVQYDIGVGTNLEYLDSQTSLELAKLNNLSATYRELLSQLQLKQTLGTRLWEKG
jgi:outer membrane protein TolC